MKEKFMAAVRAASKQPLNDEQVRMFEAMYEGFAASFSNEDEATRKAKQVAIINEQLGLTETPETSIADQIRGLAAKMDEINSQSQRRMSTEEKFMLKRKLQTLCENKDIRKAYEDGKVLSVEFGHKRAAAALMTNATVMTGSVVPQVENWMNDEEVTVLRYPQNFIIDMISSMQVSIVPQSVVETEQVSMNGNAALTAEGNTKPLVDFIFQKKVFTRSKYAGRIEYTEELELDYSRLFSKIVSMFEDEVIRQWQDGVLAAIIANYSSVYVSTTMDGEMLSPDAATAVIAAQLQVRDNEFEADQIWMNPGDVAILQAQKNSEGDWVINPFMTIAGKFGSLTLRTSTKIAAGKFLIGQSNTIKEKHTGFIVRFGEYGNQFIENEKTIVGEMFSILYQAAINKASWLYGDIATITAALDANPV